MGVLLLQPDMSGHEYACSLDIALSVKSITTITNTSIHIYTSSPMPGIINVKGS